MQGIFTISLDYELHWGVFDKRDREQRKVCYRNTQDIIPRLLALFTQYDVHVTWATVGSMFAGDKAEWEKLKPKHLPDYTQEKYSAYKWVETNGISKEDEWVHFAPDSIKLIQQYPGQELGTHTFGHYYCIEPKDKPEAFAADLDSVNLAAGAFNANMVSLVFPRNQFNSDYLKICYDKGIRAVRSNPDNWFWTPIPDDQSSIMRVLFRTGDAYFQAGKRTSYPLSSIKIIKGEPLQLPASRLLRAWSAKYPLTNKLRLRRILHEMRTAAKKNECYHLWWHPENYGYFPEESLVELEIILNEYSVLKNKYGMTSWNMGEYVNVLTHN